MINESQVSEGDMLLRDEDYPRTYNQMKHPMDGTLCQEALHPEYIFHRELSFHWRLLFRISFKIGRNYVPFTFVCDTGAPKALYLSAFCINRLRPRMKTDTAGSEYLTIMIAEKPVIVPIIPAPQSHSESNIFGLKLICALDLHVSSDGFYFENCPPYF